MLGWQLCLAVVLLLYGLNAQDIVHKYSSFKNYPVNDTVVMSCQRSASITDLILCNCCPKSIPFISSYADWICVVCGGHSKASSTTDSPTTPMQKPTTPISPIATPDDVTTGKDLTTTTKEETTTIPGTSTTTRQITTISVHATTDRPMTDTTTTQSAITTGTIKPPTSVSTSTSTNGQQTTATSVTITTAPSTNVTVKSTETQTPTLKYSSTAATTLPTTQYVSTPPATTHLPTIATTKTTGTVAMTTNPPISTSPKKISLSQSTPSSSNFPETTTAMPTSISTMSTQPTQEPMTSLIPGSNTDRGSTAVYSTTMEPSTPMMYTNFESNTETASTDSLLMSTSVTESSTITETSGTTETTLTLTNVHSTSSPKVYLTTDDEFISSISTSSIAPTSLETTKDGKVTTSAKDKTTVSELSTTNAKELSTVSLISSTTKKQTEPSTTMELESSTDQNIESSAGQTVPVTSTPALPDTTTVQQVASSTRITTGITSTAKELPTTEQQSTESTTVNDTTTSQPVSSSQVYSDATTEYGMDSTTPIYLPTTQQLSSTPEMHLSTETPSTIPPWCNYDCPVEYIAAERGCYIMVPPDFRQNFMSALSWCRAETRRDLVDKEDLTTSNMIETLKHILRLRGVQSDIMYLNGHSDYMMRKKRKAGLIHLKEISIWENLPYDYVGLSTDIVNVTGICRLPKFCEKPTCDLSSIYNLLPEKVVEVKNRTMLEGSSIMLKCLPPSRDILSVRCVEPGELLPSPTLLNCTIPADIKYEPPEKEVPGNMRIRESCEDCYRDGTDNCTAEGDGFVCNCKQGWNKFTCYKSDDLCPPQYCGPNGNCISQLDEFFCNCSAGWIGYTCDVDIKKITWSGNKTLRIISSNTIASGLLAVSSGFQISLKVLSKEITDKDPEDPQEAYQAFRSTCLTIGNLAIALFQHPDLLSQEPLSCRWFFFFVHICYSLAFVFMLDEVFNVCTTIHGLHRNNWVYDNRLQKRWWLDIPARIQFPFVLVFALLWFVASQGWSQIPTTWTCFGVFRRETSNIWYPLVLFNFICIVLCFGFAENARRTLSHRIQFWTANMHLIEVTNPYIRESIEKVRRNVPYCFLLPPFMFLNWLFLCWAADKQTDTVKFVSLLFSGIYTVLSLLQTLVTSTGVYEYVVFYGHLYLPNWISNRILQDLTPMTWLSKNEIVAKKKKTPFNELDASSPYHPASICYITLEHFHLIQRRMTREYLDHRIVFFSTQDEATLSVYFNELRLRHVYEKNAPLEDLHLEYILETWISDTKRIDQLTMPPKPKKQRETWRTRIRAKNRIPPKENTNIRRMRFLKTCMDYHLKTLNPTLEYPITGAMQRTDFRTFSPACPCVLRSQVEDLQRMWLPVIDKYMRQDWSLREVYKEFQKKNGLKPREGKYECKKNDIDEDHWLNELRPGFIGPRSYPLVYLPALDTYLELDYYQRFADLEWARLVKHSEYMGSCYDFSR